MSEQSREALERDVDDEIGELFVEYAERRATWRVTGERCPDWGEYVDRAYAAFRRLPVAPVVGERKAEPAGWLREFRPDGWSNWMPNGLYLVPPPAPVSPDVRDVPLYRAARTPEEGAA